jgi:aminopeptidase N
MAPPSLPIETHTPTPAPIAALPSYTFDVEMDYAAKSLYVQQQIAYTNTAGVALEELVLAVVPNLQPDVFRLQVVSLDGQPASKYSLEGQKLTVNLAPALPPNASLTLGLNYNIFLPLHEANPDPNVVRPEIFGYTPSQVNLVDWYPFIVPYENGWVLHDPWFYGEHLVYDQADYDISLHFSDPASAPVVASSGEQEPIETGLRLRGSAMRTFAISMGSELQVAEATVNGISIRSYYFPIFANGGQAALDATVKAVQTYTELFGPYPHKTLAVVQGDFNDGMEYDGLYFLSTAFYNLYDDTERNFVVMVAAHETCHMWWFGAVANDQAREPWLDESLATYCERLFYEKHYPDAVAWWWQYRITFYQPAGKIDDVVSAYGGFTPYTNATYRRGALFLEDLRKRIGDEAFFAFLKDYYSQMQGNRATRADFFRVLGAHTNADHSDLMAEYFR